MPSTTTSRGSTGATRSSSPSPRCSLRGRRSGSPARTRRAARSASATRRCGTRPPGSDTFRSSTCPAPRPPSRSTTRRSASTPALGFEYGYAVTAPDALVLWEAQYGDFVNGAEIIIDQFLVSGLAKWRQTSRLTLLLPHGYEGSGPEHSSARLERFLALGAEGNIRVVYPTTPAQYFHLLRRQARHPDARPMVVMTPKSLLRLPQAASRAAELATGAFRSCSTTRASADDAQARRGPSPAAVQRQGLLRPHRRARASRRRPTWRSSASSASTRSRTSDLQDVLDRYPKIESFAWVQEEPRNMGARKFVLPEDPAPGAVQDPARRHLATRALAPGGGLPRGPPRRAGAHRPGGADRALNRRLPILRRVTADRAAARALPRPAGRDGEAFPVTLGEGGTPLIHARRLGAELGLGNLHLKFEGTNPTGTFKDRGMVLAVNRAVAAGARAVVCASTGNTSASAAAYAAAAGLPCHVILPAGQGGPRQAGPGAGRGRAADDGRRQLRRGAGRRPSPGRGGTWRWSSTRSTLIGSRGSRPPRGRSSTRWRGARRAGPAGRQRRQHHRLLARLPRVRRRGAHARRAAAPHARLPGRGRRTDRARRAGRVTRRRWPPRSASATRPPGRAR